MATAALWILLLLFGSTSGAAPVVPSQCIASNAASLECIAQHGARLVAMQPLCHSKNWTAIRHIVVRNYGRSSFTFLYDLKRAIVGAFFWEAQQEAAALAQARAMHLGLVGLFNNAVVGQSTDVCLQQFGRFYTALQAVANTTGLQLY